MNFTGTTQHSGNAAGTNCNNYVQKAYFQRLSSLLISNLEIKINGMSLQNINQYDLLFNILHDFTCGYDAVGKNRIGCSADPSNKTTYNNGQCCRYAGYAQGCSADPSSYADQDTYTIGQWLGILGGNASTSIIDTSLYCDIMIEISLSSSDVLMLSNPVGTLTTLSAATNGETGIAFTAGGPAGAVASGICFIFRINFMPMFHHLMLPMSMCMAMAMLGVYSSELPGTLTVTWL
jgi:hypothetical protein